MILFRDATEEDVPAVVDLLFDDTLADPRARAPMERYLDAFRRMKADSNNTLVVGERQGVVVATYQIALIPGLALSGTLRAHVELVRIAAIDRGHGLGVLLMADAEGRARAAGCSLLQLFSNRARDGAHRFYTRLGYQPSHFGFKKQL